MTMSGPNGDRHVWLAPLAMGTALAVVAPSRRSAVATLAMAVTAPAAINDNTVAPILTSCHFLAELAMSMAAPAPCLASAFGYGDWQ